MSKKKDKAGGEVIRTKFKIGDTVWPIDERYRRRGQCKKCGHPRVALGWGVEPRFKVAQLRAGLLGGERNVVYGTEDFWRCGNEPDCFLTAKAAHAECARRNRRDRAKRAAETRKRGKR